MGRKVGHRLKGGRIAQICLSDLFTMGRSLRLFFVLLSLLSISTFSSPDGGNKNNALHATTLTGTNAPSSQTPASQSMSEELKQAEQTLHTTTISSLPNEELSEETSSPKRKKRSTSSKRKRKYSESRRNGPTPFASPQSMTMRRIKREYKDVVQMGVGYNWAKGQSISGSSLKKRKQISSPNANATSSSLEERQHDLQYPLRIGPMASNLRHWHFSFQGCGIYEHGLYHGRILLPKDYPATPPRIQLWTPSGRFKPYHDICLSASAYHPESWTPRWTVLSLVQALRLHMLTNPQEIGGMTSSTDETLEYARRSLRWKLTWKTGSGKITVDHAQMIQQGALVISQVRARAEGSPLLQEQHSNSQTVQEIENTGADDVAEPSKSDDPTRLESLIPGQTGRRRERVSKRGTKDKLSTTLPTPGARHKSLSKSKRGRKETEISAPRRKKHLTIVAIAKAVATPTRLAVLSLFLLLCVLSRR